MEKTWRWTWVIEVEAWDEIEAQPKVELEVERALYEPDGVFSLGKLKPVRKPKKKRD